MSWCVVMVGVGDEYEYSKNFRGCDDFQLQSANFRILLGLGKFIIHEYVVVAFGFDG